MPRWCNENLVGNRYGFLVVVAEAENNPISNNKRSLCQCDCGKTKVITNSQLRLGKTKSCGCLKVVAANRAAKASVKHGLRNTVEYRLWQGMLNRCRNEKLGSYTGYGARGVTVCDRWRESFENFLADMGERPSPDHSIDRIDVNGNYELSNCRWATGVEQQRNKRNTIYVTWNGVSKCIRDWEDDLGFPKEVLYSRLRTGWPVERAFTTPLMIQKSRRKEAKV